jgi:threonine dehydratase
VRDPGGLLTREDVRRAQEVVGRFLPPTPLRPSFALREHGEVLLKLECWQPTGSFKVRGALHLLASLSEPERRRGVVAASAGNHALGVAYAAQAAGGGTTVTLFVPRTAPRAKVGKLRAFPVEVREVGDTYDDAHLEAERFAELTGATMAHAFEDPRVAAGQGTVGLELLAQRPDLTTVVVPVGGGGLISGLAAVVKAAAPGVRVVAVQPEASPALRESLRQGRALTEYAAGPTLADGLAGGIGEIVFRHRHLIDDVATVSEEEIEDAMAAALAHDQVVTEGSGAVALAAVGSGRVTIDGPTALVVTGGNVDVEVVRRVLARRA